MRISFVVKIAAAVAAVVGISMNAPAQQWYRGNLHMHSLHSDGNVLPEEAVSLYRDTGYNFVCLSDHNQAQNNPERWEELGKRYTTASLARFKERYPTYAVEMKQERHAEVKTEAVRKILDDLIAETESKLLPRAKGENINLQTVGDMVTQARVQFDKQLDNAATTSFIRLKTFQEFKKLVEVPGEFLVIPGFEPSGSSKNGIECHMNFINTESFWPFVRGETGPETFDLNIAEAEIMAKGREKETLFILNHPDWKFFDVDPGWIIRRDFRFFELINCGPTYPGPEKSWSTDKFWDVINTFRAVEGLPWLYGTAADDTHGYDSVYADKGVELADGGSRIMVRANELTPQAIAAAMHAGDFYASTGVELEAIDFAPAKKTLSVKVKPQEGVTYRIEFVGTKKGFDPTRTTFVDPAKDRKPERAISVWSDDIGCVFKTVEGNEASYTLADDDLYVRARIVSDRPPMKKREGIPKFQSAWTQPVR